MNTCGLDRVSFPPFPDNVICVPPIEVNTDEVPLSSSQRDLFHIIYRALIVE